MAIRGAVILLDFDGTCLTHDYPHLGSDIGALPVLKELLDNDDRLILWTMRSDRSLDEALGWFKRNGLRLYAVNKNPTQRSWTSTPKLDCDIMIDDRAMGCPVRYEEGVKHPFVDWVKLRELLVAAGYLD